MEDSLKGALKKAKRKQLLKIIIIQLSLYLFYYRSSIKLAITLQQKVRQDFTGICFYTTLLLSRIFKLIPK